METALGVAYVYLAHASNWPGAPLIGFATATMTLSKTVLYWLQEYFSGTCTIGPDALGDMLLLIAPGYVFLSSRPRVTARADASYLVFRPFRTVSLTLDPVCPWIASGSCSRP